MTNLKNAFMLGYESALGDPVPYVTGLARDAWYIGAYFMRAGFPLPKRIERGPWRDWQGGNGFAPLTHRTIFIDGSLYMNVPCDVGTKTIKVESE